MEDQGLELRVLGPIELWAAGTKQPLPRSKKTRALLAYLAVTQRPHRRERLCSLLWDVTDDPRGALRWSLSQMRGAIGDERDRIEADREQVAFRSEGMLVDAQVLSAAVATDLDCAEIAELERVAQLTRGEFLEGLELSDFLEFNAWCIAQRERAREQHCEVLAELVRRLQGERERALPYAREHARVDAFDVSAQTRLLHLLSSAGKTAEVLSRFEHSKRMFREVGAPGLAELEAAFSALRGMSERPRQPTRVSVEPTVALGAEPSPEAWPFVGRQRELAELDALLERPRDTGTTAVVLLEGEPGAGKSRLAERFVARARSADMEIFAARAHEAESRRPYGPWVDALGVEIQDLVGQRPHGDSPRTREALFSSVTTRLATKRGCEAGVVLVFDDLQWLDRDSAELLHFVARSYQGGPLCIVVLARGGELGDNDAAMAALRGMRRATGVHELKLQPLSRPDIEELLARQPGANAAAVHEASAGNPLYAIELARVSGGDRPAGGAEATPSTLEQLVRDRVERLAPQAADILRWCSVLGHAVDVSRLQTVSALTLEEVVDAVEYLERNALLRIDATRKSQRYTFAHDVLRQSVYAQLSQPRRRLMHRKVALQLEPDTTDAMAATELAHHAVLAGEAALGVRACLVAANQSLRLFANGDAEALARRGLSLAQQLPDDEQTSATLELLHVQYQARAPDRQQAAREVRAAAERALDLGLTHAARLGFQMLSFLRWESSSMVDAHDNIMQAERVSRSAGPDERSVALAEASKCLLLLERNLEQAQAFALEADALSSRTGHDNGAVLLANGMIASYWGEHEVAAAAFREARSMAREHGERLLEFSAVEHWIMLELDGGPQDTTIDLARELVELGSKVRAGAEAATAQALLELVSYAHAPQGASEGLRDAVEAVRVADAKYELSFLLTRWAAIDLACGRHGDAHRRAEDGLQVARAIGRPSETARALVSLAHSAVQLGVREDLGRHLADLAALVEGPLSAPARESVQETLRVLVSDT